jgi:hypothetical protein
LSDLLFERRIHLAESFLSLSTLVHLLLGLLRQPAIIHGHSRLGRQALHTRSERSPNAPGVAWPKNNPPNTSPVREMTGTAR